MHANWYRPAMGGCMAILLSFALSTASAQHAPASWGYGVTSQTADASFNMGSSNIRMDNLAQSIHATTLRGALGYNATDHITFLGEYQQARQDAMYGTASSGKLYGALLRYSFGSRRVAPYLGIGGGGMRESGGVYGANMNADGWYAAFGGGASVFVGRNWGVRPDFRYCRNSLTATGVTASGHLYQVSGGLFFQFGRGPKPSWVASSLRALTDGKFKKQSS